jgi:ABC-type transport system involved in multi-copper enzyme maturation permease subunit
MLSTLRAEFKKLFTVRSTYAISLVALLLTGFLSFYVQGYKTVFSGSSIKDSLFMAGTITQHANTISIFGALIALFLLAHEFRYNTIIYTLTASNSRSKVLASKIIAVISFIFCYTALLTAINIGLTLAGIAVAGHHLPHQDINYLIYFIKVIFVCEGYALAALLFAALIRNMIAAVAVLFIGPNTVEGLLSLILKHNSVYMPFTALQQVTQAPTIVRSTERRLADSGYLSASKGALVFLAYLVGAWIVTWYLFLKRDAT